MHSDAFANGAEFRSVKKSISADSEAIANSSEMSAFRLQSEYAWDAKSRRRRVLNRENAMMKPDVALIRSHENVDAFCLFIFHA